MSFSDPLVDAILVADGVNSSDSDKTATVFPEYPGEKPSKAAEIQWWTEEDLNGAGL